MSFHLFIIFTDFDFSGFYEIQVLWTSLIASNSSHQMAMDSTNSKYISAKDNNSLHYGSFVMSQNHSSAFLKLI